MLGLQLGRSLSDPGWAFSVVRPWLGVVWDTLLPSSFGWVALWVDGRHSGRVLVRVAPGWVRSRASCLQLSALRGSRAGCVAVYSTFSCGREAFANRGCLLQGRYFPPFSGFRAPGRPLVIFIGGVASYLRD